MTKAEKIFKDTRFSCYQHINNHGVKLNPNGKQVGFNHLSTEECYSTRTLNCVEKCLSCARKDIEISLRLSILTEEKAQFETNILNMVESTIVNSKKHLQESKELLKHLKQL